MVRDERAPYNHNAPLGAEQVALPVEGHPAPWLKAQAASQRALRNKPPSVNRTAPDWAGAATRHPIIHPNKSSATWGRKGGLPVARHPAPWLKAQAASQRALCSKPPSENRTAPDWAGAATRLPGAGRRGPICRGTNRAGG